MGVRQPPLDLPIRFNIALRIYSGDMTPNLVSAALAIDATSAVSVKPIAEPLGCDRFRLGKLNGWFLSSEGRVESRDPRQHLDWFFDRIESIRAKLIPLLQAPDVRAEVSTIVWSKNGSHLLLTHGDVSKLAALGIPVWFSYAAYGDDEEDQRSQSASAT
jgi:hypothetical protein